MTPLRNKTIHFTDRITGWTGSVQSLMVHTIFFICAFISIVLGAPADRVMLILTTAVSLEAIYLSLLIQMSVNRNTADISEIQEDIEEIEGSIDEIQEDVEGIEKDVEVITEDIEEIQEDVSEIEKEVEHISDDLDDDGALKLELTKTDSEITHEILSELRELRQQVEKLTKG